MYKFPRYLMNVGPKGSLICGFMVLAIAAGIVVYYLQLSMKFDKANAWPTCDGVIKSTHKLQNDSTYARYDYAVNGTKYTEQKIFFDQTSAGAMLPAKTDSYRVGQKVKVFYNPDKPDDAFLRPHVSQKIEVSRYWSVLLFFGLALITNGIKGIFSSRTPLLGPPANSTDAIRGHTRKTKIRS